MCAALNGHIDVVNTLLQYGAAVDKAKDVSGMDDHHEHSHASTVLRMIQGKQCYVWQVLYPSV